MLLKVDKLFLLFLPTLNLGCKRCKQTQPGINFD